MRKLPEVSNGWRRYCFLLSCSEFQPHGFTLEGYYEERARTPTMQWMPPGDVKLGSSNA